MSDADDFRHSCSHHLVDCWQQRRLGVDLRNDFCSCCNHLYGRLDAFDEVVAERVEQRIRMLVEAGADETDVRNLVRETMSLVRGQE